MTKSILSFFKKSNTNSGRNVESANNHDDASGGGGGGGSNHNDTHTSANVNNSGPSLTHSSIYRPLKSYAFPKTAIGNQERPCQYQWFEDYKWLHYNERKDCVFCYFCIKHQAKLSAEHNKDQYTFQLAFKTGKRLLNVLRNTNRSNAILLR